VSSNDIVERLRDWDEGRETTHYEDCWDHHPVCAILLAADAIEQRDAEIERLRAAGDALEFMLGFYVKHFSPVGEHPVKQEALAALDAWGGTRHER
jgi:hypothetical protein